MRRWRSSSSTRTSVTARSSSAADNSFLRRRQSRHLWVACSVEPTHAFHLRVLDDAGHGYDLVAAHDERPRLTLRARHLRVDEHVLDLAPPTCQPVAGPPSTHSKPSELRADGPLAPADLAGQLDRAALEPQPLVLAHRLEPAAEVDALRADGRREQLSECRRERLARVQRVEEVLVGRRMEPPEQRQDLLADQAALRAGVRSVAAVVEADLTAVRLRLLAPERKQRMDDAVVAPRSDSRRRSARNEPVEDRLDLIGRRMAGRTQPVAADRAPLLAQRSLGEPAAVELHHVGAEQLGAEARVVLGVGAAELVIHVE